MGSPSIQLFASAQKRPATFETMEAIVHQKHIIPNLKEAAQPFTSLAV